MIRFFMRYFDDLEFLNADVHPECVARMDCGFPAFFNLQYFEGRIYFGVDGGPQVELDGPAVFWHHVEHTYQYGPVEGYPWIHHWVTFRGERARRLIELGFMSLADNHFSRIVQAEAFRELFLRLIGLVRGGDALLRGEAVIAMERLLRIAWEDARGAKERPACVLAVDAAVARIRRSPFREMDFARFSEARGVSYHHFRRVFRQRTGAAPNNYLLDRRMRAAADLLRVPGAAVKQVAATAGYEDPGRFSKLFKARMGMSPQSYRIHLCPALPAE